jgi:hypothetical protein
VQKWTMKTYLERTLKAFQNGNPDLGMPIVVRHDGAYTKVVLLLEVHSDFIVTDSEGYLTLWPLGQIAVTIVGHQ